MTSFQPGVGRKISDGGTIGVDSVVGCHNNFHSQSVCQSVRCTHKNNLEFFHSFFFEMSVDKGYILIPVARN